MPVSLIRSTLLGSSCNENVGNSGNQPKEQTTVVVETEDEPELDECAVSSRLSFGSISTLTSVGLNSQPFPSYGGSSTANLGISGSVYAPPTASLSLTPLGLSGPGMLGTLPPLLPLNTAPASSAPSVAAGSVASPTLNASAVREASHARRLRNSLELLGRLAAYSEHVMRDLVTSVNETQSRIRRLEQSTQSLIDLPLETLCITKKESELLPPSASSVILDKLRHHTHENLETKSVPTSSALLIAKDRHLQPTPAYSILASCLHLFGKNEKMTGTTDEESFKGNDDHTDGGSNECDASSRRLSRSTVNRITVESLERRFSDAQYVVDKWRSMRRAGDAALAEQRALRKKNAKTDTMDSTKEKRPKKKAIPWRDRHTVARDKAHVAEERQKRASVRMPAGGLAALAATLQTEDAPAIPAITVSPSVLPKSGQSSTNDDKLRNDFRAAVVSLFGPSFSLATALNDPGVYISTEPLNTIDDNDDDAATDDGSVSLASTAMFSYNGAYGSLSSDSIPSPPPPPGIMTSPVSENQAASPAEANVSRPPPPLPPPASLLAALNTAILSVPLVPVGSRPKSMARCASRRVVFESQVHTPPQSDDSASEDEGVTPAPLVPPVPTSRPPPPLPPTRMPPPPPPTSVGLEASKAGDRSSRLLSTKSIRIRHADLLVALSSGNIEDVAEPITETSALPSQKLPPPPPRPPVPAPASSVASEPIPVTAETPSAPPNPTPRPDIGRGGLLSAIRAGGSTLRKVTPPTPQLSHQSTTTQRTISALFDSAPVSAILERRKFIEADSDSDDGSDWEP